MKLNYKELGEENEQSLVVLHGLFGSLDNWITLAKYFAEHFHVYLVDQRNHGKSPHSDEFSYQAMSDDLHEFINDYSIDQPIVLGHSMGGKTAMLFATQHPELLEKLVVVDIAPKFYPIHHQTILKGLHAVDLKGIARRGEADKQLGEFITEFGTRQFLLKNLARDGNGSFQWKMNLSAIEKSIENVGEALTDNDSFEGETLFIRGLKSDYILDEDTSLLEKHFPNYTLESVSDAGHWIHAEAPQKLFDLVMEFSK